MPVVSNGEDKHTLISKHLILVLALLLALIITEALIFWLEGPNSQKDILALTFGTFGTWIGAGAAYFFGRENMREATTSILKLQGLSPTEILASTRLVDMNPRPVPQTFKPEDSVEDVLAWFEKDEKRFFAVVIDKDGKFQCAIHEESLYRFINGQMKTSEQKYDDVITAKTINDVITEFKDKKETESLIQAAVKIKENNTALLASELMDMEKKFVAVLVDDQGKPAGFISTGDIRRQFTRQGK